MGSRSFTFYPHGKNHAFAFPAELVIIYRARRDGRLIVLESSCEKPGCSCWGERKKELRMTDSERDWSEVVISNNMCCRGVVVSCCEYSNKNNMTARRAGDISTFH